jgi:O-antigen ligase
VTSNKTKGRVPSAHHDHSPSVDSTATAAAWALVAGASLAAVPRLASGVGVFGGIDLPMALLAISTLVAAGTIAVLPDRRAALIAPPGSRVALSALAVFVTVAASTALSSSPAAALFGTPGSSLGALQLTVLLALGLGAAVLGPEVRGALLRIAPWMLLLQVVSVFPQVLSGAVPSGTLSNATYLSQVVLLLVPIVVTPALRVRGTEAMWRWALGIAGVAGLGAAGARVGFAIGVVTLAVLGARAVRSSADAAERVRRGRILAAAAAAALLIAAGLILAGPTRLARSTDVTEALANRPDMWRAGWTLVQRSPLVGYGPDGYRTALAPIAPVAMMAREGSASRDFGTLPTDPHDVVVAILVHLGLLGAAAIAWLGYEVTRAIRGREPRASDGFGIAVLAYLGTVVLAPAPIQTLPLFVLVVAVAVGLSPVRAPDTAGGRSSALALMPWVLGGAVALVVLALALTRVYVGRQPEHGTRDDAMRAVRAAQMWRSEPFLYFLASWRLTAAGAGDSLAADPAAMRATIARAVELDPRNPFYALDQARVLDVTGVDAATVRAAFERALELFPNSPEATREYAALLVRQGRPMDAEVFAKRAMEVAPNSAEAYRGAAEVYRALGSTGTADDLTRKAEQIAAGR